MFYLKYRPKTITNLDNSSVKEKLTNLLKNKSLPHAYLFVGQKGTGKTSTARIFAKSVNCLANSFSKKGDSIEPCNKCANCMSIETGASPDVTELDAASNRGIDEVRSLIREAAFLPMTCRYRVFIIDEAHMITNDAFNALLKTLEEPPETVLFILATTTEEKVPKTIVSRCLLVNFGKANREDVIRMLKRIQLAEKISVTDDVLEIIAKNSEKSFRDATKLFEELVIQNKLNPVDVKHYLGLRSQHTLMDLIQKKSLKDSLLWIEEFSESGGSFKRLLEELLEELRYMLLAKNGVGTLDIITSLSSAEIANLMKLFTEAYNTLRISPIDSIPLEIALVEFYNRNKVTN